MSGKASLLRALLRAGFSELLKIILLLIISCSLSSMSISSTQPTGFQELFINLTHNNQSNAIIGSITSEITSESDVSYLRIGEGINISLIDSFLDKSKIISILVKTPNRVLSYNDDYDAGIYFKPSELGVHEIIVKTAMGVFSKRFLVVDSNNQTMRGYQYGGNNGKDKLLNMLRNRFRIWLDKQVVALNEDVRIYIDVSKSITALVDGYATRLRDTKLEIKIINAKAKYLWVEQLDRLLNNTDNNKDFSSFIVDFYPKDVGVYNLTVGLSFNNSNVIVYRSWFEAVRVTDLKKRVAGLKSDLALKAFNLASEHVFAPVVYDFKRSQEIGMANIPISLSTMFNRSVNSSNRLDVGSNLKVNLSVVLSDLYTNVLRAEGNLSMNALRLNIYNPILKLENLDLSAINNHPIIFQTFDIGSLISCLNPKQGVRIKKQPLLRMIVLNLSNHFLKSSELDVVSKGTSLFICRDYNMNKSLRDKLKWDKDNDWLELLSHSTCNAGWDLVKKTTPGFLYKIRLSKFSQNNPHKLLAIADVGLGTVNVRKSWYVLGEVVKPIITVVDEEGRLTSDVDMIVIVKTPSGRVYTYTTNSSITDSRTDYSNDNSNNKRSNKKKPNLKKTIRENNEGYINFLRNGLYSFSFDHTTEEGVYTITAMIHKEPGGDPLINSLVNYTTRGFFVVKKLYPGLVRITRNGKTYFDPWRKNLAIETGFESPNKKFFNKSSNTVFSFIDTTSDQGLNPLINETREISINGNSKTGWYIQWRNLSVNKVLAYNFSAPKKSPALYSFKGFIADQGLNTTNKLLDHNPVYMPGVLEAPIFQYWSVIADPTCSGYEYNFSSNDYNASRAWSYKCKAPGCPGETAPDTDMTQQDISDPTEFNDYDYETGGQNDKLEIRYKNSGDFHIIKLDTGIPPGLKIWNNSIVLRLVGSDYDENRGNCKGKTLFEGVETVRVYVYNSSNTVNTDTYLTFGSGFYYQEPNACTTPTGCNVNSLNLSIGQLYNYTPSNMNFTVRVVIVDNEGATDVSTVAEGYLKYKIDQAPNITTVNNNGPVSVGEEITFNTTCNDAEGDAVKLIVCKENAPYCNLTTPSSYIICNSSLIQGPNINCTYTTQASDVGTNYGNATCCDSYNACGDAISIDSWTVVEESPSVSLISPPNGSTDSNGNISLKCLVTDDVDIANITLWHNISGWQPNQTIVYPGDNDTSANAVFNLTGVPDNTSLEWNCKAYDHAGNYAWAVSNYTLKVVYSSTPEVVLEYPDNGTVINTSTVVINCSATDDEDIYSLSLYSNLNGDFSLTQIQTFPGDGNTSVRASFTVTGLQDNQTIIWNCKATDNQANTAFYYFNYSFLVDLLEPIVTLEYPPDWTVDSDGNLTLTCSAESDSDITNITLWHNISGWKPNQTTTYTGSNDYSVNASFNLTNVGYGTTFHWNCKAENTLGLTDFYNTNYTIVIPPAGVPYYAYSYDPASTWKNPERATGAPDGLTADEKLDAQKSLIVYNFSDIPRQGHLIEVFFTLTWYVSATPNNDKLGLAYSLDGTNWYNLDGTPYDGSSNPGSYPTSMTNQSFKITGGLSLEDLQNIRLRITGIKVGGGDRVKAFVDAIYLTIRYSPPPWPSNISKTPTTIFQYTNATFNTTWHDDLALSCAVFSINQTGQWLNTSCMKLTGLEDTATWNVNITASPGTVVQWRFYANDSYNVWNSTPIQEFIVADQNDNQPPIIWSVNVTPGQAKALSTFNITANVTDNIGVETVIAEIQYPNSIKQNYTMTKISSQIWRYLFNDTTMGGEYEVKIYAMDGNNNTNTSNIERFNVTSLVSIEKTYYGRGEVVRITGYGFSPSSNVTLTLQYPNSTIISGYPTNISTNNSGVFSHQYNIPSDLTTTLGNYSVEVVDNTNQWLNDTARFMVVIRPTTGFLLDENHQSGTYVTAEVNDSDDITVSIYAKAQKDYIIFNFTNNLQEGYNPNSTIFYLEHQDTGVSDIYVDLLVDGTYTNVCTFTANTQWTIDSCDISSYITNYSRASVITIKIRSDGSLNKEYLTTIDFGFLYMNTTISNVLSVEITYPDYKSSNKAFSDTVNNKAYWETDPNLPPNNQVTGTEATTSDYEKITTSDDNRWQVTSQNSGEHIYKSFYFKIAEDVADIQTIRFNYEGYITKETSFKKDDFYIYAWDYTNSQYVLISDNPIKGSTSDITVNYALPNPISDYISSDGKVNLLVIAKTAIGANLPKNRADIFTDQAYLTVQTIRTISGVVDINATAIDADGVNNCSYRFTNESGFNYSLIGMEEVETFKYHNVSNTIDYPDGLYNITVICYDVFGESSFDIVKVRISNQAPSIDLIIPANNSEFVDNNNITFTWNASQSSGNPVCDLYIDGFLNQSDIQSNNEQPTNTTVSNIGDGRHNWSVYCENLAGVGNSSETWWFDIDTQAPSITLTQPDNNHWFSNQSIVFIYTPSDSHNIDNCSLYINNVLNQTNTSISNNAENNFTITSFDEGTYNWSIKCYDSYHHQGSSEVRDFYIDKTSPVVVLNSPANGETIIGGEVVFNFTAIDNMDVLLNCNITVNNEVIASGINANNGSATTYATTLNDGLKYWNVTCWDDAKNQNTSTTWNFSVVGAPTVNLVSPSNASFTNKSNNTLTFYVEDNDGIDNCSVYINNVLNQTKNSSQIQNFDYNNFTINFSAEGIYYWTVECFDTTGRSTKPTPYELYYDTIGPSVTLLYPENDSILVSGDSIEFNFTVVDNLDTTLYCNLTIDGEVSTTNNNFQAINGTTTSVTEQNIQPGTHYWNVTCWDGGGDNPINNKNTSATWNFFVGGVPEVTLVSPPNNSASKGNVTFTYHPTDAQGIDNCTLFINSVPNQTDYSINNDQDNYFNLYNLSEQTLNWSVECWNTAGNNGSSDVWRLTIDNTKPNISLNHPIGGETVSNTTVRFNFTLYDNFNSTQYPATCNLTIDGAVNQTDITAYNNQETLVQVSGLSEGTHYWNVTCQDYAGNVNNSTTESFEISFAPSVSLYLPEDGYVSTTGNLTLQYIVSTTNELSNCSLIINGVVNQTKNASEIPHVNDGLANNFTLIVQNETILLWTVNCTDTSGLTGTDTERTIHVDFNPPWVVLNNPDNNSNISFSTVDFNFTAYDSIDDVLVCNLSIYNSTGSLNKTVTNISASQGSETIVSVSGFDAGTYYWNVTCYDGAFSNYSQTWVFDISITPQITLVSPENNYITSNASINFTYIPSTVADGFQYCILILDGEQNQSDIFIENGEVNSFYVENISEGPHSWSVNCTDLNNYNASSEERNLTTDYTVPSITLSYPIGGVTINHSRISFNFTVVDNLDWVLECNLTLDGVVNQSNIQANNGTNTLVNISGIDDGSHYWNVTCWDDAENQNISVTESFIVQEPPAITLISPENATRTSNTSVVFVYIPEDNSGSIDNCSLYINNVLNQTNTSISNNAENNFTITSFAHGEYNWSVRCYDPSGNQNTSETRLLVIDLQGPNITLNSPLEGETFNQNDITFNWTAVDYQNTNISCNLSIDGVLNQSNIVNESGSDFIVLVTGLADGPHNWSVACVDDLSNPSQSEVRNFTINQPDLYINRSVISFNNTNPDVNETINISVNVSNIGGRDASNVLVEFWDGNKQSGSFIGNYSITLIEYNSSAIAWALWNISFGMHEIWVYVDPNNEISELNESNNNASKNISILWVHIESPKNATWTNNASLLINFTGHDYTGGQINYSLFLNNNLVKQNQTTDNTAREDNITLSIEGSNEIFIEVTDYLGRKKNSTIVLVYYDITPPTPTINTQNQTFYNTETPWINITIGDNLAQEINYTIYANGVPDVSGAINNSQSSIVNLSAKTNGSYVIILEAVDLAGNSANSSPITIFVDTVKPRITLQSPNNGASFWGNTTRLNFTVVDNLDWLLECNITLDNEVIVPSLQVNNNSNASVEVSNLSEKTHYWNVTCWDGGGDNPVNNKNTSATWNFTNYNPPTIHVLSPDNDTWINYNTSIVFTYNVSDETGIDHCEIRIDGNTEQTDYNVENNMTNNFTLDFTEGIHDWNIVCYDNTTENTNSSSQLRVLNIDITAPNASITTENNSWFATSEPNISFVITDNLGENLSFQVFVDGVVNATGNTTNGTATSVQIGPLSEGTHEIIVQGSDLANNKANSSAITIYIDTNSPLVYLVSPTNGNTTTGSAVNFTYYFIDAQSQNASCNLSIDGVINDSRIVTNNTNTTVTVDNIASGLHWWNVTCQDLAGNLGFSQTWNFTVPAPDLEITKEDIWFNDSNIIENETVTVFANVTNTGLTTADSFIVQFWMGDPDQNGSQIGLNQTVNSLQPSQTITLNQSFNSVLGINNLFVIVDAPLSTNGSVEEENESNNVANKSFRVSSWHYVFGNATAVKYISDSDYYALFKWYLGTSNGSRIYVVDTDSSVSWYNLQALGRNTTNQTSDNDFLELDTALGTVNFSDSIVNTYTNNGVPKETMNLTVFDKSINYVPVINSTNSSNFFTGILWDVSDGNSEFNGTQDVVFITIVNENKTGGFGVYDFEIRIPARLRAYTGVTDTVTFYTEIP